MPLILLHSLIVNCFPFFLDLTLRGRMAIVTTYNVFLSFNKISTNMSFARPSKIFF
ncbi:hypothetical protein HanIR_Chr04g0155271 [Helianthus annuus]|nr:hypothetical protein HanIR_Chr04g0155271 [Helianthus annuus]